MWPDRVSNPGPPTYESGALPIALRGPAKLCKSIKSSEAEGVGDFEWGCGYEAHPNLRENV